MNWRLLFNIHVDDNRYLDAKKSLNVSLQKHLTMLLTYA
jgi:hypothetical protein